MNRTRLLIALLGAMALSTTEAREEGNEFDFLFEDKAAPSPAPGPARADEDDTTAAPVTLTEEKPPPVSGPRRGRMIEEIVVTAQKTEQTLQEVPVAVSVVDGQTLRDAGVFGAAGIENLVPNIELDTDAQAPNIGVRGFSTDSYNVGLEPSVGIIVDDIPLGRTEFIPDGLYDLQRVEVLRGPQGTLFGKNTIAGVLIFATGAPEPERGGSLLLTGGEEDEQRLEAVFNQPLSDRLLARGALLAWKNGGEIDNSFLDRREPAFEQLAGRLKFSYDASDRLQLRFGGQLADISTNYPNWQLYDLDEDALEYARSKDPNTEDDPFDEHTSFDLPGTVDHVTDLIHLAADYQLGDNHALLAIGDRATLENEFRADFDVSAADLARVSVLHTYAQNSLELRFTGHGGLFGRDLEYVGGLFAFDSQMYIQVDVELGEDIVDFGLSPAGAEALGAPDGNPLGPILVAAPVPPADLMDGIFQVFVQDTRSLAAFGQLTWALTAQLDLIAGLRAGNEKKDALLSVTSRGPGITAFVVGANDPPDTDFVAPLDRREDEISPKLGLRYAFHDDLSVYGSWTRGTKSGGFNAISFNSEDLEFEPERGDNFELGVKARLFDRSLALNLTLYHTDVSDMQVVNFNGVSFDVYNAAESVLEGFEADMTWLSPWDWLSINGALAIARAEYKSYPDAPQNAEQAADCNPDVEECNQDLSGRTLPRAPEVTASLSPTVSLPLPRGLGMELAADISHRGDQYLTLDLDSHAFQRAYTLVGARISIGAADERWGLTLRASNLTDVDALGFVADHNLYANSYFATQIPPRHLSLTLSANW